MIDGKDGDAVRKELDTLTVGGILKAEDVVSFAQDPKTALHSHFEWDDSEAAHQHRLEQARRLIRVYVIHEPRQDKTIRAFVSLHADRRNGGGYRRIEGVLSDGEMYKAMLADAFKELRAARAKYRHIQELGRVFDALEEAEQQQRQLQLAS